jgi:protein CpxP
MNTDFPTNAHKRGHGRKLIAIVALLALAGAGAAWAGHHRGGAGCRDGASGFGHKFARLHMEFAVDRALRAAEATPDQRTRVEAILEKAFAERDAFRAQHRDLHDEALAVLTSDVVDRDRLESLRARHMQAAEQGSRRITAMIAEVAEVLRPEQRQRLAAHARQMCE